MNDNTFNYLGSKEFAMINSYLNKFKNADFHYDMLYGKNLFAPLCVTLDTTKDSFYINDFALYFR